MKTIHRKLIDAAAKLRDEADDLRFDAPVSHVYNPLQYAWRSHQAYLKRANPEGVEVLFLGMNPGPWGMAQTGVPFGEIEAVRDWIGIHEPVDQPPRQHPKRPIEGFNCRRSEVSGRRLWGLFRERFIEPQHFFQRHFVVNYCPLVFMEASARNRTPDKLSADSRAQLDEICDRHLAALLKLFQPNYLVGVGAYAEQCFKRVAGNIGFDAQINRILHPSPASPAANRDWGGTVTSQMKQANIWRSLK